MITNFFFSLRNDLLFAVHLMWAPSVPSTASRRWAVEHGWWCWSPLLRVERLQDLSTNTTSKKLL